MIKIDDLVKLYNNGYSYEEISNIVGRSQRWVGIKLKGLVIPRPAKRKSINYDTILWSTKTERDENIVKLYQSGYGAYKISKKLNIAKRTVYRVLNNRGISIEVNRKSGKLSSDDIEKIIELYSGGKSCSQIAKIFNVTSACIQCYVTSRNQHDALSAISIDIQDEVIRMAKDDKLSSYKIADRLGITYQSVQHFLKRHGLSPGLYTQEWKEAVQRGILDGGSSLEAQLALLLDESNIDYVRQPQLEEFRYDFGLTNGTLIEVQGSYWHTKPQRRQRDEYKRKLAHKHGRKLLVIWDYQLSNKKLVLAKILNALEPKNFDFKACSVVKVDWLLIKQLLSDFHYQGCGRAGISIAAKYHDTLVAAAVFTSVTRLETAIKQSVPIGNVVELARFIIHPEYQATNFATWFMKRALRLLREDSIIRLVVSFADPTFGHDGTIYRASNWVFDGVTSPSYWYYHRRRNIIKHKKTIWNMAKNKNMTESEYAKANNLLKVVGQPKFRFLYKF